MYPILCWFIPFLFFRYHVMFHQAVLSPALPKHFKVFELSNSDLLPSNVQQHVRNDLHVWIVTDGQWSHLLLPYYNKVFQDILHHLIKVFNNLQHPVKVAILNLFIYMYDFLCGVYYSMNSVSDFLNLNLKLFLISIIIINLLIIYHRSNQLKEVQRDIQPYYVFITHNMYVECHDEHVMIP